MWYVCGSNCIEFYGSNNTTIKKKVIVILIIFQNFFSDTLPKAKQNEYVEDRLTNGHANGPVGVENVSSAYAAFGSLDSGDLIQFAWQIANGMV